MKLKKLFKSIFSRKNAEIAKTVATIAGKPKIADKIDAVEDAVDRVKGK